MAKRKRKRGKRVSSPGAPPPPGTPRPGPSRASRIAMWVLWGLLAACVVLAAALLVVFPTSRGPGEGRDVELEVLGDESPEALAGRLEAAGLTEHRTLFAIYVRFTAGHAVRGAHLLTDDLSPRELLARLERGAGAGHVRVTIPEGWTRFDIARRMQAQHVCALRGFLDATTRPELLAGLHLVGDSAEGFLFPATYDLPFDSDPADVVRRMKTEFDRRWAILEQKNQGGLLDLTRTLGWGAREIVILASMVEKEAVADDERPLIASVFLNRLRDPGFAATPEQPRLLQCDPTAGYGCLAMPEKAASCAGYTGKITHDVVADPANPYNTYKHEGLPPGPIANPGAKSIEAVLAPAVTRYFYFVAKGDGRSTFSETYGSHAAAVRAPHPDRAAP